MLKRFFNHLIESRQRSANREIARMLQHTEFRNEEVEYIRHRLNQGKGIY